MQTVKAASIRIIMILEKITSKKMHALKDLFSFPRNESKKQCFPEHQQKLHFKYSTGLTGLVSRLGTGWATRNC